MRHNNGTTYVAGVGSTLRYVNGLNASVASPLLSTIIPTAANIANLREVMLEGSVTGSQERTIHFLLDNGRVLSQGYNGYGAIGNPDKGTTSNPTDETGSTSFPVTTYMPPATKIRQIMCGGSQRTDASFIHGIFYVTDTGQIFGHGLNRNTTASRNVQFQSFIQYGQSPGEGGTMQMPISLTYAR